jgi:8-oxo-dGTP pyrophosphatase MutT (NUDIX family)
MNGGHVPAALRREVAERAGFRCEYCRFPAAASLFAFEVEHIVAEKHGGPTTTDNLAFACPFCNRHKGTDLGSLDPETGLLTPFFNPRTRSWEDHFSLDGARVVPRTAIGRVTVAILQLNHPNRLLERESLIRSGLYP